jgi:glycosyltransferase involved in cell wall biosynthesis
MAGPSKVVVVGEPDFSLLPMNSSLRILIVTGSFPPMRCGVGDYTSCLAEALGKHEDVRVAILTSEQACKPTQDVSYDIFPVVKSWQISDFSRIEKVIRQWRPDIVHIQYPTQGYGGHILAYVLPVLLFAQRIKIVQTWHEFYKKEHVNWVYALKAVIPGPIIVVRPNFRENIHTFYRRLIRQRQVYYIPSASVLPRIVLNNQERESIHLQYAPLTKALVAYFGFIYEHKGTDLLFDIADPSQHHLIIIGSFDESNGYHKMVKHRSRHGHWSNNSTITGFLSAYESARILSAADAIVLPFRSGGGVWNTSLHGAAIQGTFVLTTSQDKHGYNSDENIYYAMPGDIKGMREALLSYAGTRNSDMNISRYASWDTIAEEHYRVYKSI